MTVDNSQFTEEQRTEAYRREHIALAIRQAKAVETIRTVVVIWAVLTLVGVLAVILEMAAATRGA